MERHYGHHPKGSELSLILSQCYQKFTFYFFLQVIVIIFWSTEWQVPFHCGMAGLKTLLVSCKILDYRCAYVHGYIWLQIITSVNLLRNKSYIASVATRGTIPVSEWLKNSLSPSSIGLKCMRHCGATACEPYKWLSSQSKSFSGFRMFGLRLGSEP